MRIMRKMEKVMENQEENSSIRSRKIKKEEKWNSSSFSPSPPVRMTHHCLRDAFNLGRNNLSEKIKKKKKKREIKREEKKNVFPRCAFCWWLFFLFIFIYFILFSFVEKLLQNLSIIVYRLKWTQQQGEKCKVKLWKNKSDGNFEKWTKSSMQKEKCSEFGPRDYFSIFWFSRYCPKVRIIFKAYSIPFSVVSFNLFLNFRVFSLHLYLSSTFFPPPVLKIGEGGRGNAILS